tara:strand:+ start:381861 stop:382550 length:690 start_codon:yes stop_codon:yes gene_type:complete
LALASCKLRIVVPEGGNVVAQSGAYYCESGSTCDIDVVDFFFNETFDAWPAEGYAFKFWKKEDSRFCGEVTAPCPVTTLNLSDVNSELTAVMTMFFESEKVFYLEPVFERVITEPPRDDVTDSTISCSVFRPGTTLCDQGTFPTCPVTMNMGSAISVGMTYDELANVVGCHGVLNVNASKENAGVYIWGPAHHIFGSGIAGLRLVVFTEAPVLAQDTAQRVISHGFQPL